MQELSALHPLCCPALTTKALHLLWMAGALLYCHDLLLYSSSATNTAVSVVVGLIRRDAVENLSAFTAWCAMALEAPSSTDLLSLTSQSKSVL